MNSLSFQRANPRLSRAHLPNPLTASGAAVARPSCLPSSAKQRSHPEPTGLIRPFLPASLVKARLGAERFGGFMAAYAEPSPLHGYAGRGQFPLGCDHPDSNPSPAHIPLTPGKRTRRATPFDHPQWIGRRGEDRLSFLFRGHPFESPEHRPLHPQRPPMNRIGHSLRMLPGQISLPSSSSRSSAYHEETPVSGGVFNPSPASGPALFLDLSGHSPRSSVMRESDSPGGNHIALFCCAKNLRSPRVRHAPKAIHFHPNINI